MFEKINSDIQDSNIIVLGRYQSGQLGLTVTQLTHVFVGSNPALPTNWNGRIVNFRIILRFKIRNSNLFHAGVAQSIEH